MTAPVLVTGSTGRLGRLVVPRLRAAGQDVRVLSRRTHESEDGIPLRVHGKTARAMRAGANLAPERAVGRQTWEDFLAEQLGVPSQSNVPVRP